MPFFTTVPRCWHPSVSQARSRRSSARASSILSSSLLPSPRSFVGPAISLSVLPTSLIHHPFDLRDRLTGPKATPHFGSTRHDVCAPWRRRDCRPLRWQVGAASNDGVDGRSKALDKTATTFQAPRLTNGIYLRASFTLSPPSTAFHL